MTTDLPPSIGLGAGKIILFGEHAVVRGAPALASGLPGGCEARLASSPAGPATLSLIDGTDADRLLDTVRAGDAHNSLALAWSAICAALGCAQDPLHIDATLRVFPGSGLGSSAALAVSAARAILYARDGQPCAPHDPRVVAAVTASEAVFHGRASGVDQAVALSGGLIRFERRPDPSITPLDGRPPLTLAICQAAPGASTARMVQRVMDRHARQTAAMDALDAWVAQLVEAAIPAIYAGELEVLGELMDLNHGALAAMGVSAEALDAACHVARAAGALGAKLTGAGGGGCVIALPAGDPDPILTAWRARGWRAFAATL
jgi:mevalonate kinase